MRHRTHTAVVVLLCAGVVAAQNHSAKPTGTARVIGEVSARSGQPWPGAVVYLFSQAVPGVTQIYVTDLQRVTSNDRGRFRAQILAGRPYTAWAVSPQTDSEPEGVRFTGFVESVFAGKPVRLHEAAQGGRFPAVMIEATKAWAEQGPLTFSAQTRSANIWSRELKLQEGGKLVVPGSLGESARLEIRSKAGILIAAVDLERDDDPTTVMTVKLPAPRRVLIRTVEKGNDKPIAGATLFRKADYQTQDWRAIAKTEADGFAVVVLPAASAAIPTEVAIGPMRAAAATHSLAGSSSGTVRIPLDRDIDKVRKANEADCVIQLMPGHALTGTLMVDETRPASGAWLVLYTSVPSSPTSWTHYREPMVFRTAEDGRFAIPGRHDSCAHRLCVVLEDRFLAALETRQAYPAHPLAWLSLAGDDRTRQLGTRRLDQLKARDLFVRNEDGSPVSCPDLLIGSPQLRVDRGIGPYYPLITSLGRRGRARVFASSFDQMVVVAAKGGVFAERDLRKQDTNPRFEIVLPEATMITGKVTDSRGKPVANATVHLSVSSATNISTSRFLSKLPNSSTKTGDDGSYQLWVRKRATYRAWVSEDSASSTNRSQRQTVQVADGPVQGFDFQMPGSTAEKAGRKDLPLPVDGRRKR